MATSTRELLKQWNEVNDAYWAIIAKAKEFDPYESASNGFIFDKYMDAALQLEEWLNKNNPGIVTV